MTRCSLFAKFTILNYYSHILRFCYGFTTKYWICSLACKSNIWGKNNLPIQLISAADPSGTHFLAPPSLHFKDVNNRTSAQDGYPGDTDAAELPSKE